MTRPSLYALAIAAITCSSCTQPSLHSRADVTRRSHGIQLTVRNDWGWDVVVYLYNGASPVRVGTVPAVGRATLRVPEYGRGRRLMICRGVYRPHAPCTITDEPIDEALDRPELRIFSSSSLRAVIIR